MRTESDVRQALREREREAASAEDLLPRLQLGGSRPSRRRTFYLVAATCAAVVAVVVAAMLVAGHRQNDTAATPSPRPKVTSSVKMALGPKFEFSFEMGQLPSGYGVVKQVIDPGFQWAEIGWKQPPGCERLPGSSKPPTRPPANCGYGSASSWSGEDGYVSLADVLVFDKGRFDPSLMKNATAVDVNGAHGLLADIVPVNDTVKWTVASLHDPTKPPKLTTVAWPYAPDSWALVAWRNNTDAEARDLTLSFARAAHIGGRHPALVPFKVDYLPAAVDRRWELTFGASDSNGAIFGSAASKYWPGLHLGDPDRSLPISVLASPLDPKHRLKGDVSLEVAGQSAIYSPKASALYLSCSAKCTLRVGYGGLGAHLAGAIGEAELVKIAEHITVAPSLTDTSTWYDAAFALPH